jgi:multiple sugar transport system substrate-binding protein
MTWKDVLDLSYRFEAAGSRKNGVVGFFNPYTIKTLDDFIDASMNQTEGLQLIDRLRGKVTIDTPAWRSMYETAINALHNGSIRLSEPETNTADMQDLFADGKAAMYITFNNNMALKQIRSFKVGAVQAPTSVSEPGKYARSIYLPGIFSVYSGSDQKDAMWNIIRYMASEKAAKANSKLDYDISTYYKSPQLITDPLVQKLFDQKYSNLPRQWEEQNRYDSFWTSFNKLREREINKAVIGGQTVAAALGVIQKEGQKQLDQVLATSKQMEGEGS